MIPLILKVTALEAAMMGRGRGDQASLFYEFRLDERVPKDHLLRRIDSFVDIDSMVASLCRSRLLGCALLQVGSIQALRGACR